MYHVYILWSDQGRRFYVGLSQDVAHRLAHGPTLAYGAMKRLMRASFDRDLDTQLIAETAAFAGCAATQDMRAGIEAFFAKQPARFEGR